MKKWIKIIFGIVFIVTVIMLMGMSKKKQAAVLVDNPSIFIEVTDENAFLTEDELHERLYRKGLIYKDQTYRDLNIAEIENFIKNMSEVKNVKVYANLGHTWNIDVTIRKPIARIFNFHGESFYIDEDGFVMNTSPLYTARVLVFTGEIYIKSDTKKQAKIINNDPLKTISVLDDIYRISKYVCHDPFLRAQIGQIHREKNGDFLIAPQVGSHKIVFGSARNEKEVAEKFSKLLTFYEKGLPYEGWNRYDLVNLKFDKQIVCRKKE